MSAVDRQALDGWTHLAVDLVAIQRVRDGQSADLTEADLAYLAAHLDGSNEEAELVGRALGVGPDAVQKMHARNKEGKA